MNTDTLIVIPIRMGSTRFPGKPLVHIKGKPMIMHVWKQAKLSKSGDVIVACCDNIVKDYLLESKIPFVMTKKNLNSGTDRVYKAMQASLKKKAYKYVINLQGDLPDISSSSIKKIASLIRVKGINIATLVSKISDLKKIKDQNIVKVALAKTGKYNKAVYFSRAPIPFGSKIFYEHIGIYAYTIRALKSFVNLKMGELEKIESLEQLRALENGIEINISKIKNAPFSIDTPKDLKNFIKMKS